ncbi:hypothetical protein ACFFKU_17980 [Kineococcus gynurae]|uniref:DUF2470 domain-containing protein n=1 Tax=Kineococcus gynurae TaxID=452979 RepID=A0ABV5LNH2_9ACTN
MPPTIEAPTGDRRPSPAQWARTLALGVVPGTLVLPTDDGHATDCPGAHAGSGGRERQARAGTVGHPVQHLTDPMGGLLLLVEDDSPLAVRLLELTSQAAHAAHGGATYGVPAALDVLDVPPGRASLPRARLCITGWVEAVSSARQRELAGDAASVRPLGALLDVGSSRRLWRLEVADVRVTTGSEVHLLDEDEVLLATPDPLYVDEDSLVAHLEHQHSDALIGWVLGRLRAAEAAEVREVSVLGVDRYGLDVLVTTGTRTRTLRGSFDRAVGREHPLGEALCRLFACPCGGLSHRR